MYTHVRTSMYTLIHLCTLMYTHVHQYTPLYTHVHSCTPMYTLAHSSTPMYTNVHPCTLMYTHVHQCTPLYTDVHSCTPMHTRGRAIVSILRYIVIVNHYRYRDIKLHYYRDSVDAFLIVFFSGFGLDVKPYLKQTSRLVLKSSKDKFSLLV